MDDPADEPSKQINWVASSLKDLIDCGEEIKDKIGYALFVAQQGGMHGSAKPMKGFGGAGVIEIVADSAGNTYRCVYTTSLSKVIYVLHVFLKKSKKGKSTPQQEIELIKKRFKAAQEHYKVNFGE